MTNQIGARKSPSFMAVSTAPSFNRTPVGNSTPPLPYQTVADLSNGVETARSVRFNGAAAYLLDKTIQLTCKGDEAGSCKGIRSGTVSGEVKPVKGSSTVRVEGKPVIRHGDPCTMNGGNNPGVYITTEGPYGGIKDGIPTQNTDPPIKGETPEEKNWLSQWWEKTKIEINEAVQHPWEATKGALKGIGNIPSDLGEAVMKGGALQSAGQMEQAAAMQSLLGHSDTAHELQHTARLVRDNADSIDLPRFKMNNEAQSGGEKITTAASLLAGGVGLVKSGIKATRSIGKASSRIKEVTEATQEISTAKKTTSLRTPLPLVLNLQMAQ